jgi:predicted nucleic acid-binding protein
VLVDSSVWIRFFRLSGSHEARVLDVLLSGGGVVTCAPVRAEVVAGAPTRREFERLRGLFAAVPMLDPPSDLWFRLEEHRFTLSRRGYHVPLIDLMIALIAHHHGAALWTLDEDFTHIAGVLPITQFRPT